MLRALLQLARKMWLRYRVVPDLILRTGAAEGVIHVDEDGLDLLIDSCTEKKIILLKTLILTSHRETT